MKKYLIEYIKGAIGSPSFERVTLASNHAISGNCYNFEHIPHVPHLKTITDYFKFEHVGEFEVVYQWQDFRNVWHTCDEKKYIYVGGTLKKPTQILMKFIS